MKEGVTQSFIIMDNTQKIYLVKNEDNVRFEIKKVIDFSHHKKLSEVNALINDDWTHVHVGNRTLTFGGTTYNFASLLSIDVNVPVTFFG